MTTRTTVSLNEDILKLLKLKAVETSHSVSELINAIVTDAFREDNEDQFLLMLQIIFPHYSNR